MIGVEDPMIYDGISWWFCPKCQTAYNRWTGREMGEEEIRKFKLDITLADIIKKDGEEVLA